MHNKVREVEEDLEIVTLLLANLAHALDNLGNLALVLNIDPTLHIGSLFKQFGASLRKLQVGPSGDMTNVMASMNLDSRLESNL